jgi:sugar O-acyltransferase (sialic acid O-acetyltransferase NeuD family)
MIMSKMKKLVLIGAGGFGREVAWLVDRINQHSPTWELLGFVDDDVSKVDTMFYNLPIIGNVEWLNHQSDEIFAACCIGNTRIREAVVSRLEGRKFATLIDPTVIKSNFADIGNGSIICAGTIITVDINIGNHVIINLDCTIGHDAIIEDFSTVYPSVNISGNVKIKKLSEIGTGSQIIQGLEIGYHAIVGAGSVVVKDLPASCTAVGCPAKPIKFHAS